jgi:large subunit ribosomal protein L5
MFEVQIKVKCIFNKLCINKKTDNKEDTMGVYFKDTQHMYDFLDKLVNIALPRVRDFRGISGKAMDGHGNYTLGITEQIIFPEIEYDRIDKIKGLNITIVTSAKTDEEGKELLKQLGMPFKN